MLHDDAIGTASSKFMNFFTITLTSATAFTVIGLTNGALGTGVVGTTFTWPMWTSPVAGTTANVVGDVIQLQMTAPWTALVYSASAQYTRQTPGNDNSGGATVGCRVHQMALQTTLMHRLLCNPVGSQHQREALANGNDYAGPYWPLDLQLGKHRILCRSWRQVLARPAAVVGSIFISPHVLAGCKRCWYNR